MGVVFLGHLILANFLPPAEDELYYWTWSQDLAWSYFDHPPMTAWWIWFSTLFFGNSLLAIRLPAILVHLFVLYQLGQLSETKSIVTLLLFTPLSLFGAIFMTPDIPLVFFWILYLNWASGINLDFSNWSDDPVSRVYHQRPVPFTNWILGGIWLGLGLLSKYTMALAPICLFFLLLTKYRIRAWSQGFFVHLLVSAVLFLPVLYFNVNHDFYPFLFQWNHIKNPVPLKFVYTFLGSQIALVGALPFLLLPWLALNYRSLGRLPAFRSLFFFFSIPMAFFVFKSTHHFLEANWAIVTYMSFWPMSSYFIRHNTFRALVRATLGISFSVPLVISGLLLIHLVHPLRFIGVSQDRLARFRGQNEMVKT
ncbi:hypothetical protein EBT16_12465, partial [bacterium]|nr:hypothetical protein [bacterium]